MNSTFRRQLKLWIGCAAVLPILAACAAEPGENTSSEEAQGTATEALDVDLGRVAVQLSAGKASFGAQEGLSVTVTMTNRANHSVRLLKWDTLVDGLEEPLFVVTRDGAPVRYIGKHFKRPAPQAGDYVILKAGESLTGTVDLAEAYDLSATGNYTVHFHADAPYAVGALRQIVELVSNDVGLFVEGRPSPRTARGGERATTLTQGPRYVSCTSTRQSQLATALNGAASYATGANNYLNNTTPGNTSRYTTWFGTYTSSRWNTAKSQFASIKNALDNETFDLHCDCNSSAYAYVYPDNPYHVWVCKAFWNAPQTGTDSKAGTLVHETSHFTDVAATDDHAYGQSACKNLASSNPDTALNNADSHEYFAENTPAQQ